MLTRRALGPLIVSMLAVLAVSAQTARAEPGDSAPIPVEDYALYDQIITKKFLTSETRLVILERMTAARLIPNQDEPLTMARVQEQAYFDGELPAELIRDFVAVNRTPARLEGRFHFGVRYRFVSGDGTEEPEVRSAVPARDGPAHSVQAVSAIDRLAFSRVGRTLRDDHALVFVEQLRPDGTGAGFLVWFRRRGVDWSIYDTEVVWTVHEQDGEDAPLLAP